MSFLRSLPVRRVSRASTVRPTVSSAKKAMYGLMPVSYTHLLALGIALVCSLPFPGGREGKK